MQPVNVVAEGDTDLAVARVLLTRAGLLPGVQIDCAGKSKLDARLPGYNAAARGSPWLVLRDLDRDAPCASVLVDQLMPRPGPYMRLRIAVRAIEAWLMADAERLARFLSIRSSLVPRAPEELENPKRKLVDLARHSKKPALCKDMVPRRGATRPIGPGYETRIIEFAGGLWRPEVARGHSPSLDRCMRALEHLEGTLKRTP